ncbi:MAG: DNA-processing protein DprA, partial [Pseudomonadales bacterium]
HRYINKDATMVKPDDTALLYIALQYIPDLGARRTAQLLPQFDSIHQFVNASTQRLRSLRLDASVASELRELACQGHSCSAGKQALTALQRLDAEGWHVVTWEDPRYPSLLREIPAPPPLLYVNGSVELLDSMQIAMVGSRHASAAGLETARQFGAELSRSGLTVTSGLALGIDAACHRGALQTDSPTIAVVATGLDSVYPRRHDALAQQIAQNGAIVSEFPLGTAPNAKHFPQRNRLISGLSLGVLVVEAALRSGSLITARYALEQNREVFAIPGSINSPVSKGCNALIQQGAKLVETTGDVLAELPSQGFNIEKNEGAAAPIAINSLEGQETAQQILAAIGFEPTHTDKIIDRSGLPAAAVLATLMRLELLGHIAECPGGFSRVR